MKNRINIFISLVAIFAIAPLAKATDFDYSDDKIDFSQNTYQRPASYYDYQYMDSSSTNEITEYQEYQEEQEIINDTSTYNVYLYSPYFYDSWYFDPFYRSLAYTPWHFGWRYSSWWGFSYPWRGHYPYYRPIYRPPFRPSVGIHPTRPNIGGGASNRPSIGANRPSSRPNTEHRPAGSRPSSRPSIGANRPSSRPNTEHRPAGNRPSSRPSIEANRPSSRPNTEHRPAGNRPSSRPNTNYQANPSPTKSTGITPSRSNIGTTRNIGTQGGGNTIKSAPSSKGSNGR